MAESKTLENMEKILPSCWENDERMGVLFAPFRPRNLNPEYYESKMRFWQMLIKDYCENKGEAKFSLAELEQNFMRKQQKVQCLDTVLVDLLKNYEVRKRCDYEKDPFNTWLNWAVDNALKRPLAWSLDVIKKITGLTNGDSFQQCEYVHMRILNKFCEVLKVQVLEREAGKVFTYSEFKQLASSAIPAITEEGLDLCLLQLKCQQSIGMQVLYAGTDAEVKVIKIPSPTYKDIVIGPEDELRILWKIQNDRLRKVSKEMAAASNELHENIQKKNREIAKVHMRKHKMLHKKLVQHCNVLHTLETLISSLEEARMQGVILTAYKTGSDALRLALKDSSVTYEHANKVIADVRDTLDEQGEILDRMANAESSGSETEEQLEEELNCIIEAVRQIDVLAGDVAPTEEDKDGDADLLRMLQQLDVVSDNLESSAPKDATLVPPQ